MVFAGILVPPFPRGVKKEEYVDLGNTSEPSLRSQIAISMTKKQTVSQRQGKPDSPVHTSHVKAQSGQVKKKRRASTVSAIEPARKKARAMLPPEAPYPVYEIDDDDEMENHGIELVTNGVEGLDPFADVLVSQQVEILSIGDNYDSLRWTLMKMQRDLSTRVDGAPKLSKKRRRVEVWIEEAGVVGFGVAQNPNLRLQPQTAVAVSRPVKKSQKPRPHPSKSKMERLKGPQTRARSPSDAPSSLPQLTSSPRPEVSMPPTQPSSHPSSLPSVSPSMSPTLGHEKTQITEGSPQKSTSIEKADPNDPKPITSTQRSFKKRTASYTAKVVADKDPVGDMGNFTTSNVPDFVSLSPVTTTPAEAERVMVPVGPPLNLNTPASPLTLVDAGDHEGDTPWDNYQTYFSQNTEQAALHDPTFFAHRPSLGQHPISSSSTEVESLFHHSNGVGSLGVYGNGTIDPSLICGPQLDDEVGREWRSPTPTSSVPSITRDTKGVDTQPMHRDVNGEQAGSGSAVWEHRTLSGAGDAEGRKGKKKGTGTGKGKGKEKAQEKEVTAVIRAQTAESLGSKRSRKPSAKLREASRSASVAGGRGRIEVELTDADADGSTVAGEEEMGVDEIKISIKADPPRKRQRTKYNPKLVQALESEEPLSNVIMKELAEEPTTCHQCRRRTIMEKMRCTIVKPEGPCGKRFCINCILKR